MRRPRAPVRFRPGHKSTPPRRPQSSPRARVRAQLSPEHALRGYRRHRRRTGGAHSPDPAQDLVELAPGPHGRDRARACLGALRSGRCRGARPRPVPPRRPPALRHLLGRRLVRPLPPRRGQSLRRAPSALSLPPARRRRGRAGAAGAAARDQRRPVLPRGRRGIAGRQAARDHPFAVRPARHLAASARWRLARRRANGPPWPHVPFGAVHARLAPPRRDRGRRSGVGRGDGDRHRRADLSRGKSPRPDEAEGHRVFVRRALRGDRRLATALSLSPSGSGAMVRCTASTWGRA